MGFIINRNIEIKADIQTEAIRRAICNLKRDINRVFLESEKKGTQICLVEVPSKTECYRLTWYFNKTDLCTFFL